MKTPRQAIFLSAGTCSQTNPAGVFLQMVSSKYLTAFSDFRLPKNAPDFVRPQMYIQYLEDYCDHFNLRPHIQCNAKVVRVVRRGAGHRVTVSPQDGEEFDWECDAVAVCSGLHVTPCIPKNPPLFRSQNSRAIWPRHVLCRARGRRDGHGSSPPCNYLSNRVSGHVPSRRLYDCPEGSRTSSLLYCEIADDLGVYR
jgi:Flavin-binding monooxygenase-like